MSTTETDLSVIEGRLQFRVGIDADDTGVFLVKDGESFEVLATTNAARAPLGEVERHAEGMFAKVHGIVRDGALGCFIEATEIEVVAPAASDAALRFGDSLIALYQATTGDEVSASPPRRVGSMYFHPERDGVALEQIYLHTTAHVVAAALVDPNSGDVWFRTIDMSTAAFTDSIRGPYRLSWTEATKPRSRG
jgi:hypothetical protein